MSTPILISTLNSSYFHTSFGLRYLYANMGELKAQSKIQEFIINQKPHDLVELILAEQPKILGLGIYIWNTRESLDLVSLLKRVAPELIIILGGPEVSYEAEGQKICELADYVIQGEADLIFYQCCRELLSGIKPEKKILKGPLPDINDLVLPYDEYTKVDIEHRVVYVEASRGCPYKCEFCLSALDTSVRSFHLDKFLGEMQKLIDRGVRQFKFVDRTFNLSPTKSYQILEFFLKRAELGLFLHFELVPDRLPEELKELIKQFPEGALQFEIGVQTWSPQVARLVSRRQDYEKLKANFRFLRNETKVHIHSDLIAGLPGETLTSFGQGFDALSSLEPQEIQVGILKRLKGTPIIRHDESWQMVYQEHPPFQILQTKTMTFSELLEISRLAKFWDLYANSGNFKHTMQLIKELSLKNEQASLFIEFRKFSDFLNQRHPQRYGIALLSQVESAWLYLTRVRGMDQQRVREALIEDYSVKPKRDIPRFLEANPEELKKGIDTNTREVRRLKLISSKRLPERQRKHLNLSVESTPQDLN